MKTLQIGDPVPRFVLNDQHGRAVDVTEYIGRKKLVIYFYPKDESPGCTRQACAIRDHFAKYAAAGAVVIGINSGSVERHRAFAEKHGLPFTLLSDPGNRVMKSFGVKKVLFLTGRETFVVDLDGRIVYKFRAFMNAAVHNDRVLKFLATGDGRS